MPFCAGRFAGVVAYGCAMNATDRLVRASVFELLVAGSQDVTLADLSASTGLPRRAVAESLVRLADEHRLVLSVERYPSVSGVRPHSRADIERFWTSYTARRSGSA